MKDLFEPHNIMFANKETVLELNGCTMEAYPSNHIDDYRALDNPKFILLDQVDYCRKESRKRFDNVSEQYCKLKSFHCNGFNTKSTRRIV